MLHTTPTTQPLDPHAIAASRAASEILAHLDPFLCLCGRENPGKPEKQIDLAFALGYLFARDPLAVMQAADELRARLGA